MVIPCFFVIHWYVSFFLQSFFYHRYASHNHFTMSISAERFFFMCCFLSHGSSFMSPSAYSIMHRLHHVHTDTAEDPHSPHNEPNFFKLLYLTRNQYQKIFCSDMLINENLKKNLPYWKWLEKIGHNWITRICWILLYIALYIYFATTWWMFLLLPMTITMAALQGNIINWWAHKFGYANFNLPNTSKNILPVDFIFLGDAYHNNHHKYPGKVKNSHRWFETDLIYHVINVMHHFSIIRWKNQKKP